MPLVKVKALEEKVMAVEARAVASGAVAGAMTNVVGLRVMVTEATAVETTGLRRRWW
jgi:hypothetical protein